LDANRLDILLRSLSQSPTRRGIGRTLAGLGFLGALGGLDQVDAEAKKKHRKRKKKCKGGKKQCGKNCCAAASCIDGACCSEDRTCGAVCCDDGLLCGDRDQGTCVVGQGTCPTGASSCSSANFIFCNDSDQCVCARATDGSTHCTTPISSNGLDDCGQCTTDADCELLFPDIAGVFCAENATGPCGCPEGTNLCSGPCPTF
jgi:hypothetical protein